MPKAEVMRETYGSLSVGVLVNPYLQIAPCVTPEIGLAFGKCSVFAKTTIGELILDYDNLGPANVTYDKKPLRLLS